MIHRYFQSRFAVGLATVCVVLMAAATALRGETPIQADSEHQSVNLDRNDTTVSIEVNGRPALEYLFGGVKFKPCVNRWYTPEGINILRDAPHDHLHHHAMMFAVAVDGVNFWEEHSPQAGKEVGQQPRNGTTQTTNGKTTAAFSQDLNWNDSNDQLMLKERRTIELIVENGLDASLINWTSALSVPSGKKSVQLGGSHYFGLGIRFVQSMDKGGKMIAADGKKSRSLPGGFAWIAPARWMAYTAPAEGKTLTVAIFDHPQNPRFPGGIFHMTQPFAYLSATIGLGDKPYEIKAEKPLTLRYGAALWDGEVGPEKIEAVYRLWNENK